MPLTWIFAPEGRAVSDPYAARLTAITAPEAERPLAPSHVRMARSPDGVLFSWVRRGRLDADDWERTEIPLGEALERYRFEWLVEGATAWSAEVETPQVVLSDAVIASQPVTAPIYSAEVRIAQWSEVFGWGRARQVRVFI